MEKIPAIVFGDHISAYGVIRGLSKFRVPIYVFSDKSSGLATYSRYVKKSISFDYYENTFIERLNKWHKENISTKSVLIVAGDDKYLEILSKGIDYLSPNILPTFPSWEIVKNVREKRNTYSIAKNLGIPIPGTYYVENQYQLENFIFKNEVLRYPLFLKCEDSSRLLREFGLKGVVSQNKDQLIYNYKKYNGFYGKLILQEFMPGENEKIITVLLSLDHNSNPTGFLVNQKIWSSGKFLSGTLVRSVYSKKLLDYSLKLVKKIGYYGYAGVQYKFDEIDSEFKLLEVNGRVSMSSSLAVRCGVNIPFLMYKEANRTINKELLVLNQTYKKDIIWWNIIYDFISIFSNKLYLKPLPVIKSLIGKGYVIEPFSFSDPLPGIFIIIKLSFKLILKLKYFLINLSKSKSKL